MRLSDWVERENEAAGSGAVTRLSKDTGRTFATIARIVKGRSVPDAATALELEKATGGECTVREILEEALERKAQREHPEPAYTRTGEG